MSLFIYFTFNNFSIYFPFFFLFFYNKLLIMITSTLFFLL